MIYLDKTDQTAINSVKEFIDKNWLQQDDLTYKYQNIGFSDIKNPAAEFRGFFVDEQGAKCCYCCRTIVNDSTTELEHIIPRAKTEEADFERYYSLSNILRDNVISQKVFELATSELEKPPFPHHIAYQNIVASCNGRTFQAAEKFTCCNRERKDDFIPPFNLMPNSVQYFEDGTIVYMKDPLDRSYLEILNLDKVILASIRRLWYLFSLSELSEEEVLDDTFSDSLREKIIAYAIANSPTPVEDSLLTETFGNEQVWKTFKEYSYFFNYYQSQN